MKTFDAYDDKDTLVYPFPPGLVLLGHTPGWCRYFTHEEENHVYDMLKYHDLDNLFAFVLSQRSEFICKTGSQRYTSDYFSEHQAVFVQTESIIVDDMPLYVCIFLVKDYGWTLTFESCPAANFAESRRYYPEREYKDDLFSCQEA